MILPINGFAVPFHVNTVKNAVSSEAGEYMQLRINFLDVGSGGGKKDESVSYPAFGHLAHSSDLPYYT